MVYQISELVLLLLLLNWFPIIPQLALQLPLVELHIHMNSMLIFAGEAVREADHSCQS